MIINLYLNEDEERPVFEVMLNGKLISALFDTGAECITFTGDTETLNKYALKPTGNTCNLSGFGGGGQLCNIYTGTISIVQSGRFIKFDEVEIVEHELKTLSDFKIVLPVTLFKLFDIRLYSSNNRRFLEIDTHRDDKITYKTVHKDNGAISEVLCNTSFSVMKSLL